MFSKISSLETTFQDVLYDIIYVSAAQIFAEFLTCKYREKMEKNYAQVVLITFVEYYDTYEAQYFWVD